MNTEIRQWLAAHSVTLAEKYPWSDNSALSSDWREFLSRVAGDPVIEVHGGGICPMSCAFRCGYSHSLHAEDGSAPLYFRYTWNRPRVRIARPELERLQTIGELVYNEKFGEYRRITYQTPTMADVIGHFVESNGLSAKERFGHMGEKFLQFLQRWTDDEWEFTTHSIGVAREVWICENCGDSYPEREHDPHSVIVDGSSSRSAIYENWCTSCLHRHAFACDVSDEIFDSRNFAYGQTEDTNEIYCASYDNAVNALYFDNDGNAYRHSYNLPDEDEEEADDYGVRGYHSTSRPASWRSSAGYGIELEIYASEPSEFADYVSGDLILERDGSLCNAVNGIEIIGPPVSFDSLVGGESPWQTVFDFKDSYGGLYGHDARYHNGGQGMFGMHVNITNSLFADENHRARFVTAIVRFRELCTLIAQRDSVYNGDYSPTESTDSVKTYGRSKYGPCATHSNRVEVRIFKSNTRKDRFLKNVEFCEAMKRWTKRLSNHFVDSAECNLANHFAGFAKYIERNKGEFPNLHAFMAEKGVY